MKKIQIFTLTLSLALFATVAFSQIKVVAPSGDVLISNTALATTEAYLDIHLHDNTRNGMQVGSFGLQSLANQNGFLTHNCYYDNAFGGSMVVPRNNGGGAITQYFAGRTIFRSFTGGVGGTPIAYTEAMTIQETGKVQIGYTWNAPRTHQLEVNGNIAALGTVLTSDRRLKKDINNFKAGLDAVMQLNPVSYTYNGKAGIDDDSQHIGLVAQNLQEVAPDMVIEFDYQPTEMINDIAGEFRNVGEKETYLQIKDNEIKYLLVNAVQEQQAMIAEQSERIAALEAQIGSIDAVTPVDGTIVNQVVISGSDLAELAQNKPNPFNGETVIDYVIPTEASKATMNLYDFEGKILKSIALNHAGQGQLRVSALDMPAGSYSYQLVVDGNIVDTKKMVIAR